MQRIRLGSLVACLVLGAAGFLRADAEGDAKAIIAKAIKATGGEDKLAKFKAATWKGKGAVHVMGQNYEFTGDWAVQIPKQMKTRIEVDANGMKLAFGQVLDGDKGWTVTMGNIEEMDKDKLADTQEEMYANWVATLLPLVKETGFTLQTLGESKVDDRPVVGVKVTHKDHKEIELYFDKDRGLLLKTKRKAKDMQGNEADQESFYSEYQNVDGIQRAKKMKIKRDGEDFVDLEITDYKAQDKLDPKTFAKPEE
jgi:hypothetical protein